MAATNFGITFAIFAIAWSYLSSVSEAKKKK
jgi:hypothetical protein